MIASIPAMASLPKKTLAATVILAMVPSTSSLSVLWEV